MTRIVHTPFKDELPSAPARPNAGAITTWQNEWFHPPRTRARPFLKWAGGKRRIVNQLLDFLGPLPEGATYFEPFLGSGALFFALSPAKAVLSDANPALIECYRLVKDRTTELCALLGTLPPRPTRDQYYTTRDRFNRILSESNSLNEEQRLNLGSLFIWLNHTCFNGLYRVNRAGMFNVPVGSSPKPYIFEQSALETAGRALRSSNALILTADYKNVLEKAEAGDRIYLDPPYEPAEGESNFTDYTAGGFTTVDQKALAGIVKDLADRGAKVMVSNSSTRLIRALYRKYAVHVIKVPRSISRDPSGRKPVSEVVIVA
jgi:DNA adenine methylase